MLGSIFVLIVSISQFQTEDYHEYVHQVRFGGDQSNGH